MLIQGFLLDNFTYQMTSSLWTCLMIPGLRLMLVAVTRPDPDPDFVASSPQIRLFITDSSEDLDSASPGAHSWTCSAHLTRVLWDHLVLAKPLPCYNVRLLAPDSWLLCPYRAASPSCSLTVTPVTRPVLVFTLKSLMYVTIFHLLQ